MLLNSNEPPEESELVYIREVLSTANSRLASLDDEIARLERQLRMLAQERAGLLEYQRKGPAVFSPLQRMPPEILSQIFMWTLPPQDESIGWLVTYGLHSSPWLVAQICRRWRSIAISTPSLWELIAL
ncbi:hypothetical protein FB45DRAFT_748593, partial [Roridomyces roridus]